MRLWIEGRDTPLDFDYDALAETIIKSPTCVYRVDVYGILGWADITYLYAEQINARKEYWAERKMKKMRIKSAPKYNPGDVIDLSYKNGGLPNRILVTCAFWRHGDKQWMYKVFMESTGDYTVMDETFIATRASKKTSNVYKNPVIIGRIAEGWRFCGNFESEVALANGKLIAENDMIKSVRLWPAINYNNQFIKGQMGIWIVYKNTIDNNGNYVHADDGTPNDMVDIK